MTYRELQQKLRGLSDPEIAEHSLRFFKTGSGEYGRGDQFLGIRVPQVRKVAKEFKDMPLEDVQTLLRSEYHEERLCALIMLVNSFKSADRKQRSEIYSLYLDNTAYINNWDLVDVSAEHIVGAYLLDKDSEILYSLAKSDNLWERRIAVISTFHFIRNNEFEDTLAIAEQLLKDEHDLIHKAAGWMLREVGKRDTGKLESFLQKFGSRMPRTMLRYAIEKFPEGKRKKYLTM